MALFSSVTCDYDHNPVPSHKWMVFKDFILNSVLYTYMTWQYCIINYTKDSCCLNLWAERFQQPSVTYSLHTGWLCSSQRVFTSNTGSFLSLKGVVFWNLVHMHISCEFTYSRQWSAHPQFREANRAASPAAELCTDVDECILST